MKQVFLFLVMLFVANSVYSQSDEWYWDESTKDAAYEAPNSKFAKKWYAVYAGAKDPHWITLSPNGTFKTTMDTYDEVIGATVTLIFTGTWKRNKLTLETIQTNWTTSIDNSVYSQLPLRKKDEYQRMKKEWPALMKKQYPRGYKDKYDILKIDSDHLLLKVSDSYSTYIYCKSEQLKKKEWNK